VTQYTLNEPNGVGKGWNGTSVGLPAFWHAYLGRSMAPGIGDGSDGLFNNALAPTDLTKVVGTVGHAMQEWAALVAGIAGDPTGPSGDPPGSPTPSASTSQAAAPTSPIVLPPRRRAGLDSPLRSRSRTGPTAKPSGLPIDFPMTRRGDQR
jgi:hypothetical protein